MLTLVSRRRSFLPDDTKWLQSALFLTDVAWDRCLRPARSYEASTILSQPSTHYWKRCRVLLDLGIPRLVVNSNGYAVLLSACCATSGVRLESWLLNIEANGLPLALTASQNWHSFGLIVPVDSRLRRKRSAWHLMTKFQAAMVSATSTTRKPSRLMSYSDRRTIYP